MKILLVKPPLNPNLITTTLYEPLELEYLAASVRDHEVHILDMRIDKDLHSELSHFQPDLLGITSYTCDYNTVTRILSDVRKQWPAVRTVVGGNHATFMPGDFFMPSVDAVFLGYADFTFPEYVRRFNEPEALAEIPDIAVSENGVFRLTRREGQVADLINLPLPDRSLTSKYRKYYHDAAFNNIALVMTSRGCPFRCSFCACWKLMDGRYSARSPESIIEELSTLPDCCDKVYFSDDNTFSDINRMWKLNELIRKNNIRKKFQMYARADTIVRNGDLFSALSGSGLRFITMGIESFNDSDLDYYHKKTSVSINNEAIRILKNLDIHILAHIIVRPEYLREDFLRIKRYVYEQNLFRPAFPVLTPLPGTDLYNETVGTFSITNFDFFDFAHSILPTKMQTREFYRRLTGLYVQCFSLKRYFIHKTCRLLSMKKSRYYTDNTDGMTAFNLIRVILSGVRQYFRLRFISHNTTFMQVPARWV